MFRFLVLSAVAVAEASECHADESSMLQMRNLARFKNKESQAQTVLKSMKHVAANVQNMKRTDVNDALNEASTAISTLTPTILQQVQQSQQQINDAAGAVTACHAQTGIDQRADLLAQVSSEEAILSTCNADLEALRQAMENQCNIARDCLCDEATVRHSDKAELCAARTEVYELAWCEHNMACTTYGECHAAESGVYTALQLDVQAEMATVTQEYIATEQSGCLMSLITAAFASNPISPINPNDQIACLTVDTSALAITYPTLPGAPEACPAAAIGDPQCTGGGWRLIAEDQQGSGNNCGQDAIRTLSFACTGVAPFHYRIETQAGGEFVEFKTNTCIFGAQFSDTNMDIFDVVSSNSNINDNAKFCKACTEGGERWGDTCWGVVTDSHRSCGCNSGGWTGTGMYYGGYSGASRCASWPGSFSGFRSNGQQKGSVCNNGVKIYAQ